MKNSIPISVVIPVFNEENTLLELNKRLEKTLKNYEYELIYVNDGSTDKSAEILKILCSKDSRIKLVSSNNNTGKYFAYTAGLTMANKELITMIDSDLQVNPEDIKCLVSKLSEGYDVVVGWRKNRKDSLLRVRLPSLAYNFLLKILFKTKIHDAVCPLKVFKSDCLKNVNLKRGDHRLLIPILKTKGCNITEVEINHNPRRYGKSKFTLLGRVYETIWPLIRLLFKKYWSLK